MQIFKSRNRIYYFLMLYVSVFAVLALLGYYAIDKTGMVKRHDVPQKFVSDLTFYDLPRMTVALNNNNKQGPHVRLDISLEVTKKDIKTVEGYQPHMVDKLNSFFVTVDASQIQQSRYMPWLHSEMLKQVNSVGSPAPVHDVFLRQMLIM